LKDFLFFTAFENWGNLQASFKVKDFMLGILLLKFSESDPSFTKYFLR